MHALESAVSSLNVCFLLSPLLEGSGNQILMVVDLNFIFTKTTTTVVISVGCTLSAWPPNSANRNKLNDVCTVRPVRCESLCLHFDFGSHSADSFPILTEPCWIDGAMCAGSHMVHFLLTQFISFIDWLEDRIQACTHKTGHNSANAAEKHLLLTPEVYVCLQCSQSHGTKSVHSYAIKHVTAV